jgi:hypothetical protein
MMCKNSANDLKKKIDLDLFLEENMNQPLYVIEKKLVDMLPEIKDRNNINNYYFLFRKDL